MSAYLSIDEQLAQEFYDWELIGRGWQVWDDPVSPEPPFRPFIRKMPQCSRSDDGRDHSLLSGVIARLARLFAGRPNLPVEPEPTWTPLRIIHDPPPVVELALVPPADFDASQQMMAQLLASLAMANHPIAFEILASQNTIVSQFAVAQSDASAVRSQIQAHFPEVALSQQTNVLKDRWDASGEASLIFEIGLSQEFMRPLPVPPKLTPDVLVSVMGAMEEVSTDELALMQMIFEPARYPWAASMLRAVTFNDGSEFFDASESVLDETKEKLSRPLYAAVIRLAVKTADEARTFEIARSLTASLTAGFQGYGNDLIALSNDEYDPDDHEFDTLHRQCRRSGMILNSDELVNFVHIPSSAVRTSKFTRQLKRTKRAPAIAAGRDCVLGENFHAEHTIPVGVAAEERSRHMHLIGASGTGKSQLLLNLIVQDMEHGKGLGLLDPHGDLVDDVLSRVPEDRIDDVVLLDPSDETHTVGINILSARTEVEKTVLASDLVAVFQRLATSWGDQMTSVLGNAILAFLERPQGGTLADLRRFLIEPAYRNEVLSSVTDPEVIYYWKKQFPLIRGMPLGSVLTRLDTFLRRKPIRQMVCLKEKALDFADIMDRGKIFLARIPQGLVGEENAHLLGSLLVSKFYQLAMVRQQSAASHRRDFYLYIDEFHHFVTPSMSSILSEARKYRLALILAHQELRQLESRGVDLSSAVLSHPYTRICFRVGDQDAKRLAEGFSFFTAADLQSLSTGEAICRMERSNYDFNLRTKLLPELEWQRVEEKRRSVIERSRDQFAVLRSSLVDATSLTTESFTAEEIAEPEVEPIIVEPKPETPAPAPRPIAKPPKVKPLADEPANLGRGGPEHQYLQQLIKQWAQGMGYRASIEAPLPEGGSVDIALEKGNHRIACETSVTNTPAYEVSNIRKSLVAKYQYVAVVTTDLKHREKIEAAAEQSLTDAELKQVRFFSPDELFAFVQELEVNDAKQERLVCGYKVKTSVRSTDAQDQAMRQQAIAQVVARSVTRMRKKKQ